MPAATDKPVRLWPFTRVVGFNFGGGELNFTLVGKVNFYSLGRFVVSNMMLPHAPVYGAVADQRLLLDIDGQRETRLCTVTILPSQTIYKARVRLLITSIRAERGATPMYYGYPRDANDGSYFLEYHPDEANAGGLVRKRWLIVKNVEDITGNFTSMLSWFNPIWELVIEPPLLVPTYQGRPLICETVRYSDLVGKVILWPRYDMTALIENLPGPCWKPVLEE